MRQSQTRHFKKPRFPCFKLKKLDQTDFWQNYIHLLCHKWVWPTFEIQNMGNEAFQNALFGNASFGNGNEDNSCLWVTLVSFIKEIESSLILMAFLLYLTLFHLGSGMTLLPGGRSKSTAPVYGPLSWPRDCLVAKTCSRINILIFSIL